MHGDNSDYVDGLRDNFYRFGPQPVSANFSIENKDREDEDLSDTRNNDGMHVERIFPVIEEIDYA